MSEQHNELATRPREEVEAIAERWFEVAKNLKTVQDELATDLETALNIIRNYQGQYATSMLPDPNLVAVRNLLTKYKMNYVEPAGPFKIYADGVDITTHPDSIDALADEMGAEFNDRVELVMTEDGRMHFRPVFEEKTEPEPIIDAEPIIDVTLPLEWDLDLLKEIL